MQTPPAVGTHLEYPRQGTTVPHGNNKYNLDVESIN